MKMKFCSVTLIFTLAANLLFAQTEKDPVLLTIGGKNVTKSEFQSIYNKNNNKDVNQDPKNLEEYLQLFINFKLKVREAEELGMDTTAAFINELEGYRKQLVQPYLVDNEVNEKLLREAYERMQTDIRANHILIKIDQNALPKDTVAAYNKIIALRNRILKGEDFEKVAKETSEDPSAKENGGDLGYFTALQMVYPFETIAFNTKPGDISQPVRTRFGYHIIKVADKRPAQGQILTAHIMIKSAKGSTEEEAKSAKDKINEIYQKLQAGENFEELARQYSDDKGTAKKGGELPWFGTGRMVVEFERAAFALKKNGDYTEPVQTQYGWHIIKRVDKKDIPSFDETKNELKTKISKDSRSQKSRESLIAKIMKDYNFKETLKSRDEFYKLIDTTYFEGKWDVEKASKLNKPLFSIGNKNYTQSDFTQYLQSQQTKRAKMDPVQLVNNMYKQFKEEAAIEYEESKLSEKYPEFHALMQEYRDGILLFELTDKKVWSKAVKDTAGLTAYYEKNKNNFMWNERVDATVYINNDENIAKLTRKYVTDKKKRYPNDKILEMINKESQLNLKIEEGKFQKGDNEFVDLTTWKEGLGPDLIKDKKVGFVMINKIIKPEPKSLNEAKGLVTAEYQNYLEKQWVEELKKKYPVTVNKDVLSTVQ